MTQRLTGAGQGWPRALLLALLLLAFARVTWELGGKDLWWDESLSLQRAEASWPALILGRIPLADGDTVQNTTDQHPFFFFLLQGILVWLAGNDESVLRFVSAAAATLAVPAVWVLTRYFVRREVFPPSAPVFAALLAAISPFLLWYGQEARPYALWALLALLSTYTLVRATAEPRLRGAWAVGYTVTLVMFLATHYYALFLLPVHAALIYRWLAARSRIVALVAALALVVGGVIIAALAFWWIVVRQNAGGNFAHVSWKILLPDVLNAFSLGLSVDITRVWLLDLLYGALALAGAVWCLRGRRVLAANGWLPVAMFVAPVLAVILGNAFYPVYMNARHLSLIAGPFILLVAGGLGLAWRAQPWVGGLLALALVLGSGYSTVNYFTLEEYAKDDFSRLGGELDNRLAPGDLVLIKPPYAWRIFSYYLPAATMHGMPGARDEIAVYGAPMLGQEWPARDDRLAELTSQYRRIWFLLSATHPYQDLQGRVETWLDEHLFRVNETTYFSHSSLKSSLYLPEVPVYDALPAEAQNVVDGVFGDTIRLAAYDVGPAGSPDLALPVTLYWQAMTKPERRYKYILSLVELDANGQPQVVSTTEREPYDGTIPTIYWDPGKTIVEYTELPPAPWPAAEDAGNYRLTLQLYDAETLERLPVTDPGQGEVAADGQALVLPFRNSLEP